MHSLRHLPEKRMMLNVNTGSLTNKINWAEKPLVAARGAFSGGALAHLFGICRRVNEWSGVIKRVHAGRTHARTHRRNSSPSPMKGLRAGGGREYYCDTKSPFFTPWRNDTRQDRLAIRLPLQWTNKNWRVPASSCFGHSS